MKYRGTNFENPEPGCSNDQINVTERLSSNDIEVVPIEVFDNYPFLVDFLDDPVKMHDGFNLRGN